MQREILPGDVILSILIFFDRNNVRSVKYDILGIDRIGSRTLWRPGNQSYEEPTIYAHDLNYPSRQYELYKEGTDWKIGGGRGAFPIFLAMPDEMVSPNQPFWEVFPTK